MNNIEFLEVIKRTFLKFLTTGSRSNEKLKILHGAIAKDLSTRLGYQFQVKSLGFGDSKEGKIQGRYIDKNVDITILKENIPIAGIGIKFIQKIMHKILITILKICWEKQPISEVKIYHIFKYLLSLKNYLIIKIVVNLVNGKFLMPIK